MFTSLVKSLGLSSNKSPSTHASSAANEFEVSVQPPFLYAQCRSREEKIAWLNSDTGQNILKTRPILHEYYHNGYIYQIIDNPYWKVRLEDWLTLPVGEEKPTVPYGLTLPKTEEEKLIERQTWIHPPCENPPLSEVFGEYFDHYRSSPEYYLMPLENRLQLLADGFTILRNIVPLDIVENAESSIAAAAGNADVQTLEKLGLAREIIYDNYGGTIVRKTDWKSSSKCKEFGPSKDKVDEEALNNDKSEKNYTNHKKVSTIFGWSSKTVEAVRAPTYERKVNEVARDPFFLSGTTNDLPVLALYYMSRVHIILEYILHGDKALSEPFRTATGGAQIAYRFSQPLPASQQSSLGTHKIGGSSWHIDGLQNGAYGSFSFLVGFPLSEQQELFSGNLCLHPGSHYSLQPWLKEYAMFSAANEVLTSASSVSATSSAAIAGSQRHLLTPSQREEEASRLAGRRQLANRRNNPILDEPVQVQVSPGDVVIALHKVAHLGGPNYRCKDVRKMVYFRVSHRQHATLRYEALEEGKIWIEYEGLHDLL